jgi:hypothetical protein
MIVSSTMHLQTTPKNHTRAHTQNNPFARAFDEVVGNLHLDRHLERSMFDPTLYHIRRADASSWVEELKVCLCLCVGGRRGAGSRLGFGGL